MIRTNSVLDWLQVQNEEWAKLGAANSPLGLIHGVNFKILTTNYVLEESIKIKFQTGEISQDKLEFYIKHHYNVVKQIDIKWLVIK